MSAKSHKKSMAQYGADQWGSEFLQVNDKGRVEMLAPGLDPVDLHGVARALDKHGFHTPFTLRFPSRIEQRMRELCAAFERAVEINKYRSPHVGVYPLKVNQRRSVVEAVADARTRMTYGLEAGSKPELLLAMAQIPQAGVPLVLNGFKDEEYMVLAHHAAELGHEVIVVLESLLEVRRYLAVTQRESWAKVPMLGMRAKLYSRGSGRWRSSGGEQAKFGLTTVELLEVVRELGEAQLNSRLVLMHFHIGSQITQIKRVKRATREAVRLWAGLLQVCPALRFLDVGGGIGVDYDGSKTSYESSANYDLMEYASQVVYEISEVCRELEVEHPTILTESGRVIVADHSVTVTDLRELQGSLLPIPGPAKDEDRTVSELRYTLEHLSIKNLEEYFHDAQDLRDEALDLFARGHLSLDDRAKAEGLFHRLRVECQRLMAQMQRRPDEIQEALDQAQAKYVANFSVFQSLPDTWSVDQVFPAAPLSRHNEAPTVNASIVDITCDSDGCIKTFAHPDENLKFLPLHVPDGQPYYLGFFLTGAYQDSLANEHNLYSRCHEVIVRPADHDAKLRMPGALIIELDATYVLEVRPGLTNQDALLAMDYDVTGLQALLRERHAECETTLGLTWPLGMLRGYPYLKR